MLKVKVDASKKYDIIIGTDLLSKSGELISSLISAKRVAVITDDTVEALYLNAVKKSLSNNQFEVITYVIKNGEDSKCAENYIKILNFLANNRLSRSDLLVALGGGVVGDLAGFVAASYLRGIKFIQLPTTLLSAVDSSVGGKTAINLDTGKNLAGAFYQPELVLCDYLTLNTLSERVFRDGCGEVIKYGILQNEALFSHLEEKNIDFDREYVIAQSVKIKSDIVNMDEFDNGTRQLLNLGHTVGHAIEKLSNYKISHGEAVAIGISVIVKASLRYQFCEPLSANRILNLLQAFNFTLDVNYSAEDIFNIILSDKKIRGNKITLVIPKKIGECVLTDFEISDLLNFIKAGLEEA